MVVSAEHFILVEYVSMKTGVALNLVTKAWWKRNQAVSNRRGKTGCLW